MFLSMLKPIALELLKIFECGQKNIAPLDWKLQYPVEPNNYILITGLCFLFDIFHIYRLSFTFSDCNYQFFKFIKT